MGVQLLDVVLDVDLDRASGGEQETLLIRADDLDVERDLTAGQAPVTRARLPVRSRSPSMCSTSKSIGDQRTAACGSVSTSMNLLGSRLDRC